MQKGTGRITITTLIFDQIWSFPRLIAMSPHEGAATLLGKAKGLNRKTAVGGGT
jgi:hypothetical protein